MKYLIIIEETKTGYSAYSPDLPGCISTGKTVAETESNMHEAIDFHLDGMRADGLDIPPPLTRVTYHEVSVQD
jgi:predicted RNase H-like HicB family nuclease